MSDYEILDPRFQKLIIWHAKLERLWTGCRWAEGPVYVPAAKHLLWSDIPNDRVMRFDEGDGSVSVFETGRGNQNGHTLDAMGRVVACEQGGRNISRLEHDGSWKVLADRYGGKRLNSPNDVVVRRDGSIWFTDPSYGIEGHYEGSIAPAEIGASNVYRLDEGSDPVAIVTDMVQPNGLAFSPDEKTLYVTDSGESHVPDLPRAIRAYDVAADGRSATFKSVFAVCPSGILRRLPGRSARQPLGLERRCGARLRARRNPDRSHPGSRIRLKHVLRRPARKPPLHHRSDLPLFDLSEHPPAGAMTPPPPVIAKRRSGPFSNRRQSADVYPLRFLPRSREAWLRGGFYLVRARQTGALWTRFPGAEEVRVMRQEEADVAEPHFEMVLAIRYPSRQAVELALASDVRAESRAVTADLMKMFEGDIFHSVFRADQLPLAIV